MFRSFLLFYPKSPPLLRERSGLASRQALRVTGRVVSPWREVPVLADLHLDRGCLACFLRLPSLPFVS